MAGKNPNAPQAGFSAAPQPGFGAAPTFGFASAGNGTRSYGSAVPKSAFLRDMEAAEALAAGEGAAQLSGITVIDETARAAEEARHDTSIIKKIRPRKAARSDGYDEEGGDFPDLVSRATSLGIIIGRRVVVTRGSRWRAFESDLQSRSSAYSTVPYNKLTMPYLTDSETDRLLDQVVSRAHRRNRRPMDETTIIRGFRRVLADDIANLVHLDRESEAIACDTEPQRKKDREELTDFLERIAYPDRHAYQTGDRSRPSDDVGIFTNATFLYRGLGSIGIATKTILLEDYTGVNAVGRNKVVDMIGSKHGLDTSHIKEDWDGPQIPIWHMVGRNSLAGFRYTMPETPLDVTLGPATVFERP